MGQEEVNQDAPLWGLMDGKREGEIQEIWELSVQGLHLGDCRRAQAKGQGHCCLCKLVH